MLLCLNIQGKVNGVCNACCIVRCGENTENEFGIPVFVGKPVYIYTKTSPFIEIWKKIFLPMRKWLQKICRPPLRGWNSKFSQLYVVGTLNLCLETPGTMQKVNPITLLRENIQNIQNFGDILKQQNRTTFWKFSPGMVIRLSWFLLHCARRPNTQV